MPQIDDLKQQQTLDEAKTGALNAAIARMRAERALAKALQADGPPSTDFAVPKPTYTGTVSPSTKAGGIESSLLAARALAVGSHRIATRLKPALDAALGGKAAGTPVLLYDFASVPAFQALVAYKTQYAVVQKTIASAIQAIHSAWGPSGGIAASFVTPALAGLALESLDQLLGFFRTDYSVEGVDVAFIDNISLLNALAGELAAGKYDVRMPAVYSSPDDLATDPIFAEITALANQDDSLRQAIAAAEAQAAAPVSPTPQSSGSTTSAMKDALAFAKSAQALYDAFAARLISGDDKGQLPLDSIMRQSMVRKLLEQGSPMLAVRLEKAGGTYYTRRNMWSFFGGMPFFNMGGVVITYALFAGDTGSMLASGTVPVDGGFVRISNLPQQLGK